MLNNQSLAKYTTYKVGGPAKIYVKPENTEHLSLFLQKLPNTEQQIFWLGLGSNVLIRDHGIDGAVIHTYNNLNTITILETTNKGLLIKAEAGLSCAKLAKFCVANRLQSGVWFAGIPGTIGGALAMNAGAFGGTAWDHVLTVEVINREGKIIKRNKEQYKINYRSVIDLDNNLAIKEWFLSSIFFFSFSEYSSQDLQQQINYLLNLRKKTQPIGELNCGSVFKNPKHYFAGQLIESAKLKGLQIGDAMVSKKHANFIINLGQATAKDIENLINLIQKEVLIVHNILLEPEVRIVG